MLHLGFSSMRFVWRSAWLCVCVYLAQGAAQAAESGAAATHYDIYEYRVEGNSLLNDGDIERAVTPFLGENKALADIEAARATLERQYHDAGFITVLVSIPEQSIDSGVVTLSVVQAPVSKLRVVGSQYNLPSDIKSGVTEVAEGRVPNFLELQRQLGNVNKSADMRVSPILKPGKTPGTVEVQLDVEDQLPLHASLEVTHREDKNLSDTNKSPQKTPTKISASVRYDNLWQRHHSLGITLQTSPEDTREVRTLMANYMLPVGSSGDALSMFAVQSRGETPRLAINSIGNVDQLGLRYALTWPSDERFMQSATLGVDIKRPRNGPPELDDVRSVVYAPFTLSYHGAWLNQGTPEFSLDVGTKFGLRGLLGANDAKFAYFARDVSNVGSQHSANFMALTAGIQSTLPWGRWTVSGKLDGQAAFAPLLSSEQFFAGGADSVRGYKENEANGDVGIHGSLELSTPTFKIDPTAGRWRANGLAFMDAAWVHKIQWDVATTNSQATMSLLGAGLGLRLTGPYGMSLQIDGAKALKDGDVSNGGVKSGDWTWYARWVMEF